MNIKMKVIQAIDNNEFIDLLKGKGDYKIELHQWVSANVPTDVESILTKGIYPLYLDDQNKRVELKLEQSLITMIDGELFDIYCALSTIFCQLIEEGLGTAPFKINQDKILNKLRITLNSKEKELKNYFEWEGLGKPEGMWTEVLRMDSICKRRWGISLL
ncbi:hypothetical protein GLV94_16385 [Virgibacillus halodenitrificans]|uniref:hypothetical protein n=1 Tax=Virgibacillus TaxID=84406 RepID=UPI000A5E67EB|nr:MULTISPECIES: hypothetical protein [Virgibacillus]MYL47224.1 hypothetical protein [Virgibacillus halodenitrificans]